PLGQPLDGRDLGAGRLRGHHGAGLNCAAIQMDYAGPALPGIAPHMRPGQAQRVAQELDQERSIFDLPRHDTPVDLDFDRSHLAPSLVLSVHEYIGPSRLGKERLGAGRARRWRAAPVATRSWPGLSRPPCLDLLCAKKLRVAGTSPPTTPAMIGNYRKSA